MPQPIRKHAKIKPGFRAAVRADGVLEMLVYEDIGMDWWDGGGVTAKTVKQQIDNAGIYSSILIRINSPGGDAFEGVAIHNLLKSTGKPLNVVVDGIAASAASIIAMCGTTIEMGHSAMMMIHNAWTFCMGNAADMTKMAETLGKIDGAIAQTYVDRTGKSMDDVRALMDAETWMSADECVEGGFATAMSGKAEEAESDEEPLNMARRFAALARYRKVPKALVKSAADVECACDCAHCQDGECDACTNADCDDANCKDCPMQSASGASASAEEAPAAVVAESDLSFYEARFAALKHGLTV